MKEKKFQRKLIIVWTVTTLIVFVLNMAQEILPIIFRSHKYMDMLMERENTLIPLIICLVVLIAFGLVAMPKKTNIQDSINVMSKKKSNRFIVMAISLLLCVSFILVGLVSVVAGVSNTMNVKNINGTVENVISTSDEKNGEVYTLITVKDSKGKTYNLEKSSHLDGLNTNKKDKIKLNYTKSIDSNKISDGYILGYTSNIDKIKK